MTAEPRPRRDRHLMRTAAKIIAAAVLLAVVSAVAAWASRPPATPAPTWRPVATFSPSPAGAP
jgi:hypothetical protein